MNGIEEKWLAHECGCALIRKCRIHGDVTQPAERIAELEREVAAKDDEFREYNLKAGDEYSKLKLQLAAKEQELKQSEAMFDDTTAALEEKLKSLAPHGTCACDYDKKGDVCAHHSPALQAANRKVERLASACRAAFYELANCGHRHHDVCPSRTNAIEHLREALTATRPEGE